jgi:uridine kinase
MTRPLLIKKMAHCITQIRRPHPVRVAIDGIDNAGKTILADELGRDLRKNDSHIIRASIDGFHRTRQERYRRGHFSPEGYFFDSFNLDALAEALLKPLGPAGDLCYTTAIFDFHKDIPVIKALKKAEPDAVLLFDGVFLLRPELNAFWDFRIFVHISYRTALQRALKRDLRLFGDAEETRKRYLERYIPGQKLYLQEVNPKQKADFVIGNDDPTDPIILKGTGINP